MDVENKVNLMNKLAIALAKEESITPVQALARIKKEFMDREETTETIRGMRDYGNAGQKVAPEDAYAYASEQTKVELKKLEFQNKQLELEQKRLDAETKKQDYLERKLESERDMALKKLESERDIATKKLESEEKIRRDELSYQRQQKDEDHKIESARAATERLILLSNLSGGKKGGQNDEMLDFLKLQNQSTSEYYKAQGESTKGLYETLLQTKNAERDKEYEWKRELAKIEADREVEMAKLRAEDPKAANSTEVLVDFLGEKFETLGKQLSTNPQNDFLAQIESHNKFQESLIKAAMPIFKAQGLSEEQLQKIKDQVGMEEKRQEGTLDKLFGLYKRYIEPAVDKATHEMDAAPSGLEQNRISPEVEKRIRAETEAKARQMEEENVLLQQQLEEEKKRIQIMQEERRGLESRANDLGIKYDDIVTNEQLFYAIEQQEAINEQYKQQKREERTRRAIIPQEVSVQEGQVHEAQEGTKSWDELNPMMQAPDSSVPGSAIVPKPQPEIDPAQTPDQGTIDIQEELAKPRETSPETEEFINGFIPQSRIHAQPQEQPEPEAQKEVKKQRKARTTKKDKTGRSVFKVTDGTNHIEVDALNHKGAALSVTNQFVGTQEHPVRLTVTNEGGEERQYDTFNEERESTKGKKFMAPRLKAVV